MKNYMAKKYNKKGISTVIATIMMIALVLAVVAIVWGVVQNLISKQLEEAGSCFNILEKVSLEDRYTCFNGTGNEILFGINIADIDVGGVVIMISGEGTTKSYTITTDINTGLGLLRYPQRDANVKLPDKNGGLTYISKDFTSRPDSIRISPVIGGNQCDVVDSISNIQSCI